MRSLQSIAAAVAILGATLLAGAHEFWVGPASFTAAQGDLGRFYLMHGHRFDGDIVPRNEPYVERFEVLAAGGTQRVLGRHGQPANVARFAAPGTSVVVYESREVRNELSAERFEAYLQEEGLGHISRERERLGEAGKDGLEVYVRCAKALVGVAARGEPSRAGLTDRVVGLPMEIVLEPLAAARVGQTARVRVLFGGEPLAGIRVVVVSEARVEASLGAEADGLTILRTDDSGYASFELDEPGPWMVTGLHMVRTDDRDDADWKSFWASLTFGVGADGPG